MKTQITLQQGRILPLHSYFKDIPAMTLQQHWTTWSLSNPQMYTQPGHKGMYAAVSPMTIKGGQPSSSRMQKNKDSQNESQCCFYTAPLATLWLAHSQPGQPHLWCCNTLWTLIPSSQRVDRDSGNGKTNFRQWSVSLHMEWHRR